MFVHTSVVVLVYKSLFEVPRVSVISHGFSSFPIRAKITKKPPTSHIEKEENARVTEKASRPVEAKLIVIFCVNFCEGFSDRLRDIVISD